MSRSSGGENHLHLAAEDGPNDGNECPSCGRRFNQDGWDMTGHGGDSRGGVASYECPTEGCPGTASVVY